ncbi:hypothetical protein NKI96_10840 [Mesorhizobium sp. M0292]|uniref:DUF7940 domain-containing protein n=1 Tax=Mesorhizobium sp. M0292 TaxID=2956929 RepID=UPI00333903FF
MKLVSNTGKVLRHSYSLHLNLLGFICWLLCIGETIWPLLGGYLPVSPIIFVALTGVFTGLAMPARVVVQRQLSGDRDADQQD